MLTSPPSFNSFNSSVSAPPSISPPLRRSVNCELHRRLRQSVCPSWPPVCEPPPRQREGLDGADHDLLVAGQAVASSPLLLPSLPVMVATTPLVRWKSKRASWSCESITVRSETTSTVSKTFLFCALCSSARKCAVQAMELVLPEPAECWTRYLPPGPSLITASWSLRVTSS